MDAHPLVAILLREDLAVGGQEGQQAAVLHAHLHVQVEKTAAQRVAHLGGQLLQARPLRALIGTALG